MAVIIRPLSATGSGVLDITTFSDSFNRASAGSLGNNWFAAYWGGTPLLVPAYGIFNIAAISGPIQGLVMDHLTTASAQTTIYPGVAIAMPLVKALNKYSGTPGTGVSQYAQLTLVHRAAPSAADINGGPGILLSNGVNGMQGYFFGINSQDGHARVWRIQASINTYTALIDLGVGAFVDGDIARLNGTIDSGTGNVTLECFKNGVSQGSVVDSAGSRALHGVPGLFNAATASNSGNVTSQWKDFVGGKL